MNAEEADRILAAVGLRFREFENADAAADAIREEDGDKVIVPGDTDYSALVAVAVKQRFDQLRRELADWRLGSDVEADAGDEARSEVRRLRADLEEERSWRLDIQQAVQEKDSMFMREWARAESFNDFWHWAEHGERMGWCSPPVCATHDGIPSTPEEQAEWEDGFDPCEHVLRLWPDET